MIEKLFDLCILVYVLLRRELVMEEIQQGFEEVLLSYQTDKGITIDIPQDLSEGEFWRFYERVKRESGEPEAYWNSLWRIKRVFARIRGRVKEFSFFQYSYPRKLFKTKKKQKH